MTVEAATTVVETAGKARLPSSIAMLMVVLGLFFFFIGSAATEKLRMQPSTGVAVGGAGGSSGAR